MLAAAGVLDGRECTAHWRYVDALQAAYPKIRVTPDVLYVQDGTITTGAGSAAGLDAALHVMRQEFGADVAAHAARRMVVPPHRDGGQAQFIRPARSPRCEAETLGPLLQWAVEHLADDLSVERLAREVHLSPRTFARRFRDETGTTPHAWVVRQRVQAAEALLERSDQGIDQVAARVGFGNAAALRHHFTRVRGVSPQQYRRSFGLTPPDRFVGSSTLRRRERSDHVGAVGKTGTRLDTTDAGWRSWPPSWHSSWLRFRDAPRSIHPRARLLG